MSAAAAARWIRKRDGRLVPFEADKICRSLFAASEALGRPDAFLARELTDGVLHFLAADLADSPPTTAELSELIVKVVRELGHPAIARRFASASIDRPAEAVASGVSLDDVFPRDLVSAHRAGLLTLTGLETPLELTAVALGPASRPTAPGQGLPEDIAAARLRAGQHLAIDGPEFALAALAGADGSAAQLAAEWARELRTGLQSAGLSATVNLNIARPPVWAEVWSDGPLFANAHRPPDEASRAAMADALLEELIGPDHGNESSGVRVAWHLTARDFTAAVRDRLLRLARHARDGAAVVFGFDRPRRPVTLAEGMDRSHPAVLLSVGIDLSRLADQRPDPAVFLQKLGSLARLAKSAGRAKQDFLRRRGRPEVRRGFLLDRARLVVAPLGLAEVVGRLLGPASEEATRKLAGQVLRRLGEALEQDPPRSLEACLDWPPPFRAGSPGGGVATSPREQLLCAGEVCAARGGTATLTLPEVEVGAWAGLLHYAWQQTELVRLRLTGPADSKPAASPGGSVRASPSIR